MTGNELASLEKPDYVPAPRPAKADRLVGALYFPGWKPGAHKGWSVLAQYPERKPLLGWYDESNPQVADWEIKWALEHGVSFFVYCWYRNSDNAGKRITTRDLHLGHAIHESLFNCRYKALFRFAIMWENFGRRGMISSLRDLQDNLVPFWAEEYFAQPFYLKLGGRPVLFVYHLDTLIEQTGGMDGAKQAVAIIKTETAKRGLGDVFIFCEYRGPSREFLEKIRACGFDAAFAYCWHTPQRFPNPEEAINRQLANMAEWRNFNALPFAPTASVGWDPMPWAATAPETPWLHPDKMTRWYLPPERFRELLERIKKFTDPLPADSPARSMLLLDNWNEWAEGHFISPSAGGGFEYLQAVRDVFTDRLNLPDYRTPEQLGLGPCGPAIP